MAEQQTVESFSELEDEMVGDDGLEQEEQDDLSASLDDLDDQVDDDDEQDESPDDDEDSEQDDSDDQDDESDDDDEQSEDDEESESEDKPDEDLYTVKVNGEEQQVALDDLKRAYSSASESARLAQEAQQIRKQSENLVHQLRSDPISVLQDERLLGPEKLRSTVEDWLIEQYQYENASEDEREAIDAKRKVRQYEEEKRLQEQEQQDQLAQQYYQELEQGINQAIENSDIPHSDYAVNRIVQYLRRANELGQNVTPEDVMPWVEKDYQEDLQQMLKKKDPQKLVEVFGQEALDNLRKADADKLKSKSGNKNNKGNSKKNYHIGNKTNNKRQRESYEREDGTINSLNDIFGKPGFDE